MKLDNIYLSSELENKLDEKLMEYNNTHDEKLSYQELIEKVIKDWIRYGSIKNI